MRTNRTKAKLKAGETVFGCFVRYPDPGLVEFLGYQGWDFLIFDAEHGVLEPRDCENMTRAAELLDVTPLVRATTNQQPIILRFLDTGAQGVHVPWVRTASEAQAAVRSVKYHPLGIRGLASVRAADYGQRASLAEYTEQANDETLVVIQIETAEAVEQLPEIAMVDGVDVFFIGPTDLSHSLGYPGQLQHPVVQEAMQRIVQGVAQSGADLGILVSDVASAHRWQKLGARYIVVTLEALLASTIGDFLHRARPGSPRPASP
jgi:4-hydroxy-2-oxoheptanedioate aldolase